ncbi:MAG: deoxynucleoside kinase [Saprospiraceae bacterium]
MSSESNLNVHPKYIAVSGNIGAGKTTLCEKLGKHFDWEVQFESTDDNPYLNDFYEDMSRWAFNLQVYFLHNRYKGILDILKGEKTVIQDRTIFEDAHIFAPNLHQMGLMSERDFNNYFELFQSMQTQIQAPDLVIYLRAGIPTLVNHIGKRGREYEGSISIDYLKRLNVRYDDWIQAYNAGPKLIVDVNEIDFVNKPEDLGMIIDKVSAQLGGLF